MIWVQGTSPYLLSELFAVLLFSILSQYLHFQTKPLQGPAHRPLLHIAFAVPSCNYLFLLHTPCLLAVPGGLWVILLLTTRLEILNSTEFCSLKIGSKIRQHQTQNGSESHCGDATGLGNIWKLRMGEHRKIPAWIRLGGCLT